MWKKLGVTNPIIRPNNKFKGAKRFFNFDGKLLFNYADQPEFYLADFDKNIIESFEDEILFLIYVHYLFQKKVLRFL